MRLARASADRRTIAGGVLLTSAMLGALLVLVPCGCDSGDSPRGSSSTTMPTVSTPGTTLPTTAPVGAPDVVQPATNSATAPTSAPTTTATATATPAEASPPPTTSPTAPSPAVPAAASTSPPEVTAKDAAIEKLIRDNSPNIRRARDYYDRSADKTQAAATLKKFDALMAKDCYMQLGPGKAGVAPTHLVVELPSEAAPRAYTFAQVHAFVVAEKIPIDATTLRDRGDRYLVVPLPAR